MRLKSLQIKGFKSFANETILHFNDDVIGVVGPNGSGKSNIVDAIRWVLGEQKSKELRLESMGDVIFNGTKSKKEAASATVALTFENNKGILPVEYQFVTISRTLYRSGESEYRLNNVVCRLKDITSLFIDTGIGSNSYAIIALGMVDDILENKDNARRRMFEQAAGVSKYKMRKRETLLKLKNTEEDLNRIEDLLFEIEGNVKTLEKQAKRTQKYNEIKLRYKELSIQHAVYSIQSLKEQYKETAENLRKQQDVYRENDTLMYGLQAQFEKEKKQNLDKELALSEKQKKMNELVSNLRALENDKVLLRQKLEFTLKSKETLKKTLAESSNELASLQDAVEKLSGRLHEETGKGEVFKEEFEKINQTHRLLKEKFAKVKTEFDEKQKKVLAYDKEQYEIEKEMAIITNSIENIEIEISRAHDDLVEKQKSRDLINREYDILLSEINKKSGDLRQMQASEEERLKQIELTEKKLDEVKGKLVVTNRVIDSKQNEYDLLKSMIESFEGYPESIKFLHENWQKDTVILGDLLDVVEEYKPVIESYLDQYLNYFVVDSPEEAFKAIELLSKAQRGKANFFILNHIDDITSSPEIPSVLVPAIQQVSIDTRFNKLLFYLLKDCFIYDGDPQELDVLIKKQKEWVILSKHGHYIKTKCTLSGGSVGLFEGKKIGRKKNLDHLSDAISKNQKQKGLFEDEMAKHVSRLNELKQSQSKQKTEALSKEVNDLRQQFAKVQVQSDNMKNYETEFNKRVGELKNQMEKLRFQKEEKSFLLKEISAQKEMLVSSATTGDSDVARLSEELALASEKLNQDNIQVIRHQNLVENLKKELEYKNGRIAEYTSKMESDKYRLLGEERAAIDVQDEISRIEAALVSYYEEKKNYNESLTESEQAFFQTKNAISKLDDQIRDIQKRQNQLQGIIQQLKDSFTELKFKIGGVGERLKIEFDIPVNDIINKEPDPNVVYEEVAEEIEKIRSRISNFGDINPLALEAYNEMNERYQKIVQQKNDIISAKDSLLQTITEIDSTATGQFHQAFSQIRENFISVFRELFTNDDTCDLILVDPSNPLESDIEIIAKPKGKKPKSISQLSGGEKTLTSTALLFALYLLKPAPFCIFDEVDAPLDDANIQKFNKIIQKFSKDSQFIVVTHNKSTMVEVNILYGVYMQEPGVSAVSAVDFTNLRPEN